MSVESVARSPLPLRASVELAVLAALASERAALIRVPRGAWAGAVLQTGPGPARAGRAAQVALARGARALVSWGLAGGLAADVAPGTVLLPNEIVAADGDTLAADREWRSALVAALAGEFMLDERPLYASDAVLATAAAKAECRRRLGAAAVDMESAAIGAAAQAARARFVVIRVVVDAHDDALPEGAERFVDERGNQRLRAAIDAAFAPRQWPALVLLARRYALARKVLDRLARRLVPAGFLYPGTALR